MGDDAGVRIPTIVLAAGLGTRLLPLTLQLAKPAVPVAGKALVVRVLEWLRREGVDDVVVNLHHLPATVTSLLGDGGQLDLRVRYSWEREILGSAGGPARALALWPGYDGPCLVVNGDTLTDFPLAPLLAAHTANRADGALTTMTVVRNTRPDHYNGLRLDADGRVLAFVPKGHTEETWHFVGVQVVESRVFADVPADMPVETVAGLYREWVEHQPGAVRAWRVDAPFLDVGTPDDYLTASLRIAADEGDTSGVICEVPWAARSHPAVVEPSADLRECVIWPDATIEANVSLERCVVVSGARVPEGTRAQDKVFV